MRRRPEQLAAALDKGLKPVYLVTGDEPLQRLEAEDAIRSAARRQGYGERVVFDAATGMDWNALRFEADSLSLFASRRLIDLRLGEAKPGDAGGEAIAGYCERPPADVVLIIAAAKIDRKAQQTAWFRAIEATGDIIEVWPLKPEQMPGWIGNRLESRGLTASAGAIRLLADRVEGNLPAAAQDVDKLALLCGDRTIGEGDVLAAVGDSARYDIFALADTAFSRKAAQAVRMLRGLRDEGAEAVLVCWALTRELRAACLLAARQAPEAVIGGYRLFPPSEQLLRGAARRLGSAALYRMLLFATGIDRVIKGLDRGDPWNDLTALCLAMAGQPPGDPRLT